MRIESCVITHGLVDNSLSIGLREKLLWQLSNLDFFLANALTDVILVHQRSDGSLHAHRKPRYNLDYDCEA